MRTIHHNWGEYGNELSRGFFRKHLVEMRAFSQAHVTIPDNNRPAILIAGTPKAAAAPQDGMARLLGISYVLNLVKDRGALLLPKNWQN